MDKEKEVLDAAGLQSLDHCKAQPALLQWFSEIQTFDNRGHQINLNSRDGDINLGSNCYLLCDGKHHIWRGFKRN